MNKFIFSLCLLAALAGCSTTSPDVIQRGDAQRLSQVQDATVLSVRAVTVDGSQTGMGAATGAVVGGVAGSQVGGNKTGAVVGVLAHELGHVHHRHGLDLMVRASLISAPPSVST